MMVIDVSRRTIDFKLVYYGAAMSGKTTNLEVIAQRAASVAGPLTSLATRGQRTLYFDLVRLSFGEVAGFSAHFNLYTTPGQNVYSAPRRLVLKGADGVVFVMDSQQSRLRDNVQAWYTLERQLFELKMNRHSLPLIIQLNKRDMPFIVPVDQLLESVRAQRLPHIEASAQTGSGVMPTLHLILQHVTQRALDKLRLPSHVGINTPA